MEAEKKDKEKNDDVIVSSANAAVQGDVDMLEFLEDLEQNDLFQNSTNTLKHKSLL